jgi:hypothetical protein
MKSEGTPALLVRGRPWRWLAGCLVTVVALASGSTAIARPRAHAATSGDNSERVKTIPVARHPGQKPRVVMTLPARRIPTFKRGDRLRVSAEVQVTTTCVDSSGRCIGRPYRFTPTIDAKLMLASGIRRTGGKGTVRIGRKHSVSCKQRRPNRNHHCVLVLTGAKKIDHPRGLPCRPRRCRVNLVVDAHDGDARSGNVVVVGADRPNGSIVQDSGRLNALVLPDRLHPKPVRGHTRRRRHRSLPMGSERSGGRRVIYSFKVRRLDKGDILTVSARQTTAIGHLPYSAYVNSEVILAGRPGATRPSRLAKRSVGLHGRITEANGFNCTQGPSAYRTPCRTRKAGLIVARHDAATRRGRPKPLFVNLVSRTFPKLARATSGDEARIKRSGYLKVSRIPKAR